MNLTSNARDAMPRGGTLTIETGNVTLGDDFVQQQPDVRPGEYVMLRVRDTGSGMDDATIRRIFEPFFTTKEVGKGTGMGLAAVYGIVKQHSGAIVVDSERGRGTTLSVFFPRVDQASTRVRASDSVLPLPRGTETVLLVEDERQLRSLTRVVLRASGYTVIEAGDAEQAFHLAEQHSHPIQLLITDMVLARAGWARTRRAFERWFSGAKGALHVRAL